VFVDMLLGAGPDAKLFPSSSKTTTAPG
jgi:hypothetical protein